MAAGKSISRYLNRYDQVMVNRVWLRAPSYGVLKTTRSTHILAIEALIDSSGDTCGGDAIHRKIPTQTRRV